MAEKTEDLNLPLSVISRIIKESLPDGVLVSKEARTAVARAASVFVLHATTHANQSALNAKRKTITAQDVIEGVVELDMDDFVEPLKSALEQWKSQQGAKTAAKKAAKDGSKKSTGEEGNTTNELNESEEVEGRNDSGTLSSASRERAEDDAEPMDESGVTAENSIQNENRVSEEAESSDKSGDEEVETAENGDSAPGQD